MCCMKARKPSSRAGAAVVAMVTAGGIAGCGRAPEGAIGGPPRGLVHDDDDLHALRACDRDGSLKAPEVVAVVDARRRLRLGPAQIDAHHIADSVAELSDRGRSATVPELEEPGLANAAEHAVRRGGGRGRADQPKDGEQHHDRAADTHRSTPSVDVMAPSVLPPRRRPGAAESLPRRRRPGERSVAPPGRLT